VLAVQAFQDRREVRPAPGEVREDPAVLHRVVVQAAAEGQAVHPELGTQFGSRLGDLLPDQGELAPERVVDEPQAGSG
jgi:hypothetical protein